MTAERIIVVETRDHLQALRAPFSLSRHAATVRLPTLPDAERHAWESRLKSLLGACGCEAGAICLLLAIAGYAAWVILGGPLPVTSPGGTVLLGLGLAVLAAVLGKVIGLAIARYRLTRAVERLARRLPASSDEGVARV